MVGSCILAGIIIYCVIMFRDLPRIYFLFVGPLFFIKKSSGVLILLGCFFGVLLLRVVVKKVIKLYKGGHKEQRYYYPVFDENDRLQFKEISVKEYRKSLSTRKKRQVSC